MSAGLLLFATFQLASPASDTIVVTPGPQHRASGIHRFLLGSTYRDLWSTPIRAPVLDLERHGGGMVATERGGSKQTRSLRFRTADGRILVFRALEKDPTQAWPQMLRRSPARGLAEDQISALLPGAALAVSSLEGAIGLLAVRPSLYVLPDDPRLGSWREEFKGNLGLLEERVRGRGDAVEAALGASQVISTEALFERLLADGANQVDGRGFLAARLFDLFVGDWDRHFDQWSWARFDEGGLRIWRPVPRDRDWAFSRLDGPLYGLLRLYMPKYQSFGERYGSTYGLTLSAEPLDRRLLVWLERPAWDSVVSDLVARLDDRAIDAAVARLPEEYGSERRASLSRMLRARRDALPEISARFYAQLASAVNISGSNSADQVDLVREPGGAVTVTLTPAGGTPRRRRFDPGETREIRMLLGDGDDDVRATGTGPEKIVLRIVGGAGTDRVSAEGNRLVVYDDRATHALTPAVELRSRPHTPAVPPHRAEAIQRDWGHLWSIAPWFDVSPEIGVLVGGGPILYRYGFRKEPYAARLALRLAQATGRGGMNADLQADLRFERPDLGLRLRAAALDLDVVRYFGQGNETAATEDADFYQVAQRDVLVEPTLEWRAGRRTSFSFGGFFRASTSDLDEPSLLASERPYGAGSFHETGVAAAATFDSRDLAAYPTRGVRVRAAVRAVPALLDVDRAFGSVRVDGSGYLTARGLPATPTLALRAGATGILGRAPFFEAATVGGRSSVRGLSAQRFQGDAAVFAGAELRFDLGGFTLAVPGDWGVFALADAGRVFLEGERSRRWHGAAGGGLWFAFLDRRSTMAVTVARGDDRRTRMYVQGGMAY